MQQYVHSMAWVLIVIVLAASLPVVREKVEREGKRKEKRSHIVSFELYRNAVEGVKASICSKKSGAGAQLSFYSLGRAWLASRIFNSGENRKYQLLILLSYLRARTYRGFKCS